MATSSIMPQWTSTFRSVPFALAVNSWTLSNNKYVSTFSSNFITQISKEIVLFDETLENSSSCILVDKIQNGGGLTFTAESIPEGTISGTIYVIDRDDGKVPVLLENTVISITNGGTGANSATGAITNLGIDTLLTNLQNQITSQISQAITAAKLAMYPIGSIYINTADINPSTFIGGTWQKIEDRFLVGAGEEFSIGDTGGKSEYIADDMPAHTHTRGTMNITGEAAASYEQTGGFQSQASGAFYIVNSLRFFGWGVSGPDNDNRGLGFDASRNWTGETSQSGLNETATILPPYLAVYIFKRTA